MRIQLLKLLLILYTFPIYGQIRTYPSGIDVNFEAQKKGKRSEYLIQFTKDSTHSNLTSKFIRIINGTSSLPKKSYVGIIFYNEHGKKLKHIIIKDTKKPTPKQIFFMDRNSGKHFQGMLDIYYIPKDTVSFSVGIINKKGEMVIPLSHPDFDKNNSLPLQKWLKTSPNKPTMLQFEITGTDDNFSLRLGAFYFV